jgi:3',5'-cyclic AMP phosphodiesterase CpdA
MMASLVDPRRGDIETDASSPERRSLLALAGSLLAEVSLPKLAVAILLLIVVPAGLLGLAPLLATILVSTLSSAPHAGGWGVLVVLALLVVIAWFGGRPLFRVVENSFWSLNAMMIQPGYVATREGLLHLSDRLVREEAGETRHARARVAACMMAGLMMCVLSLVILRIVWPSTHWVGTLRDLATPHWLALAALANAVAVAAAYQAVAGIVWALADATMPQPRELTTFRATAELRRSWRVAHISDIHVVGERYGFRVGPGRAGPRGNGAFIEMLRRLDDVHRRAPLDAIVLTGDLTDAGTPAEWAELLDAFDAYPHLTSLLIALPGNHDLNVVDRANPARLDLPTSPAKRLRQVRTLSALDAIQGSRVRTVDAQRRQLGESVRRATAANADTMIDFAEYGSRGLARQTDATWAAAFPMVLPPSSDEGLGIIALNSNADTHFSFTNALGIVPADQVRAISDVTKQYPRACWIVALHHQIVEHPKLGHALADRIGTTLINGNWVTRELLHVRKQAIVMHGHRHIDWMGQCGGLVILSAPSAVMTSTSGDAYFYVHTLGVDASGGIGLAEPERVPLEA